MALRLTAILLLVMFAVLRFGGRDTGAGPFAEYPHESAERSVAVAAAQQTPRTPRQALLAEAPAVTRLRPAPDADSALPAPQPAVASVDEAEAAVEAARTGLDMAVIDTSVAPGARSDVLPVSLATAPAAAVRNEYNPTAPEPRLAEVIGSGVNLRAGPSVGTAVVGRARSGDQVMWVADVAPGWAMVRHPGYDSDVYMASDFLRRTGN